MKIDQRLCVRHCPYAKKLLEAARKSLTIQMHVACMKGEGTPPDHCPLLLELMLQEDDKDE